MTAPFPSHCCVDVFPWEGRYIVRSPQLPGFTARVERVDRPALERQMKAFHSRHMSFEWFYAPTDALDGMGWP